MSIDPLTFLAQVVNFAILIWLLNKVLYGPILSAIEQREARFLHRESELDQLDQACVLLREELEGEKKAFQESVEERHREAAAQARALKDHELEKARHEVQSLKQRWSEGLNEQREEFLLQLRRKTSDSALSIAGRVLGDLTGDDDLQRVALERFLEKCDELPVEGAVVVRVAAELTEEQKKRLEEKLPAVRYEVDPDLLVGLELVHEGHRIGWSARAHLQAMEEEVDGLIRSEATLS